MADKQDPNGQMIVQLKRGMVLSGIAYNAGEIVSFPKHLVDRLIEQKAAIPMMRRAVTKAGAPAEGRAR